MRSGRGVQAVVGAAAVLLSVLALTGVAAAAPPTNDAFANATVLPGASGSLTGTNVDATTEGGEPPNAGTSTVWYEWTAPADGTFVVSTIGSNFDSSIALYAGDTLGTLTLVSRRLSTGLGEGARVQWPVSSGQTFRVQVGSEGAGTGAVKLAWRMAQVPANDDFADAQVISGAGGVVNATNVAASDEVGEPQNHDDPLHTVWYEWTAPTDGVATFDTLGADFDTIMAVFTGEALLALDQVDSNDDNGGTTLVSRIAILAEQGTTYRIAVDGYHDAAGEAQIGSFTFGVNRRTFSDVSRSHPFWNEIEFANVGAITTGYPDGTFRPAASISRAAMSAFLYRLAWEDFVPPATPTFPDVPTSHPFFREIEWMNDGEITTGYDDGTFRPSSSVTRAAMSAFIFRYNDGSFVPPGTPTFSDVPTGHPFFLEIEWMNNEGITTGYGDGTFRPGAAVSRGAMAAFLYRYEVGPFPAM